MEEEWFKKWFNSPYYHILYQKRDRLEASAFIDRLILFLGLPSGSRILDLACGQGRHSRYLATKSFEVTGIDLSGRSIRYAQAFEKENLRFFRHDMRDSFRINYFDATFNFFTSFGYFDSPKDDLKTLKSVSDGLKKNGVFVLDFFNSNYIIAHLKSESEHWINGLHFKVKRRIEGKHVIKEIAFQDQREDYFFQEKVRLFTLQEFKSLFIKVGLNLFQTFGNYELQEFNLEKSPRLILLAKK